MDQQARDRAWQSGEIGPLYLEPHIVISYLSIIHPNTSGDRDAVDMLDRIAIDYKINEKREELHRLRFRREVLVDRVAENTDRYNRLRFDADYILAQTPPAFRFVVNGHLQHTLRQADHTYLPAFQVLLGLDRLLVDDVHRLGAYLNQIRQQEVIRGRRRRSWLAVVNHAMRGIEEIILTMDRVFVVLMNHRPEDLHLSR